MIGSTKRWLWVLTLLAVPALLLAVASASEEDDRRRLIDEIDDLLDDAASDLDGLASESSASDVDRAIDRVARVKDKARELERVQGDDSRAERDRISLSRVRRSVP